MTPLCLRNIALERLSFIKWYLMRFKNGQKAVFFVFY
jgi:hypothetical protein